MKTVSKRRKPPRSQHARASIAVPAAEEVGPPECAAPRSSPRRLFRKFAIGASNALGAPWAFSVALTVVVIWALLGPVFHYSDTWQLVINTGTTIITFLMVFLIQHSQNRESAAMRVKIDELLRAVEGARNSVIDAEELEDDELQRLLVELRNQARKRGKDPAVQ